MTSMRDFPLTIMNDGSETTLHTLIGNRDAVIGENIHLFFNIM
jgi:hypothetical protein